MNTRTAYAWVTAIWIALLVGLIVFTAVMALRIGSASAQNTMYCAEHGELVKVLGKINGETLIGHGRAGDTGDMEVYVNPQTGSFSIVVKLPTGLGCLAAAGTGWRTVKSAVPGKDV